MGNLKAYRCDTLYLALEDTPKRIQRRVLKQGIASDFNGSRLETSRCTVHALRAYLKANPQYRVVIIDTLQKMLGINDMNDYSQTVDGLSALKAIADDMSLAIIVIHHNRKGSNEDGDHMESALGSTGINATADATITMKRKRGTNEATLSATGRDIEDASYSISWDRELCTWTITGQGALKPILTETQQQIISLLESEEKDWTTGEIKEGIEKSCAATSNLLKRLHEMGCIESPSRGKWRVKDHYTNSHLLREREFVNSDSGLQKAPAEPDSAETASEQPEIW
jgi:RecA-family ATPase